MLHDIGKCIDSKGHDQYAMDILDGYVSEKTLWLINHHMRIWYFLTGEMKKLKKVKDFYTHEWFKDVVLLARWDKLARNPNKKIKYNREKLMSIILEKVLND
jgi:predicted HD phosphohydrolase